MNSKEKIEYLIHEIKERARISPHGAFHLPITYVLGEGLAIIFSEKEQREVLEKFQVDGLIWIIEQDKEGAWVALINLDADSDESPYAGSQSGTQLIQPYVLKTNLEKGLLSINGKSVFISTKAGKENNPLRLLKTLTKSSQKYWYEDEILADWEQVIDKDGAKYLRKQKRIPRHRVYHAARDLNTKILKDAGVRDFIEHDTSKYRINPLYLGSL
jgi:hypothetical protein